MMVLDVLDNSNTLIVSSSDISVNYDFLYRIHLPTVP